MLKNTKQASKTATAAMCLILLTIMSKTAFSEDSAFLDALGRLENHPAIKTVHARAKSESMRLESISALKDPVLKTAAKNYTLHDSQLGTSQMTGIEIGISQKIPLTMRKRKQAEAAAKLDLVASYTRESDVRKLRLKSWQLAADWEASKQKIALYKESLSWLESKLKVTESLYANGQASQQAVYEIKISAAKNEAAITSENFNRTKLEQSLSYLFGKKFSLENTTIPWGIIQKERRQLAEHPEEQALIAHKNALALAREAKRSEKIPDLTLGAGYTFRPDAEEDFISLSVAIDLPVFGRRTADYGAALSAAESSRSAYDNFKIKRDSEIQRTKLELERLSSELDILTSKSIRFASSSRDIVSKSYSLGNATYVELLSSELSLVELKLKEIELRTLEKVNFAQLSYLMGDTLWQ